MSTTSTTSTTTKTCTVLMSDHTNRRADGTCKSCRLPMTHHDY
jgi:hypothetical protein